LVLALLSCSEGGGGSPGAVAGSSSGASAGSAGQSTGGTDQGGAAGQSTGGTAGIGQSGSSAGGTAPQAGAAGAGGVPIPSGTCDDFGPEAIVRTFTPQRFALGDDPSADAECTEIENPERGFRSTANLRGSVNFSGVRSQGMTTVYGAVLLDDYRDQPLDQSLLELLGDAFAEARSAGVKLLPRFYYQANLEAGSQDASLDTVLGHIAQLAPVLADNADVIAALHAGFVGAWGEWHGSTTGLHMQEPRDQILAAVLGALPASRMVLVRRPSFKSSAYEGGPVSDETAYEKSDLSRLGHLNDCFLASDSDSGTYQNADEKDYAAADSAFTAVDGETCAENPPRSECEEAKEELALHHWSLLNINYHSGVLDSWRDGGCFDEIACRLGYRLVLLGHSTPPSVRRGEALSIALSLSNDGYARPYNERPVWLVLDGPERRALPLALEPRRLAPGEAVELCLAAAVPADLAAGDYALGLALPDASPTLAADERYAVRLANDSVWQEGINWLDASVSVTE
jgi:hypothetical protein